MLEVGYARFFYCYNVRIRMQSLEQNVYDLLNPGVDDMDLRLVRVRLSGGNNPTLQIMIEPKGTGPENMVSVDVEQCAEDHPPAYDSNANGSIESACRDIQAHLRTHKSCLEQRLQQPFF